MWSQGMRLCSKSPKKGTSLKENSPLALFALPSRGILDREQRKKSRDKSTWCLEEPWTPDITLTLQTGCLSCLLSSEEEEQVCNNALTFDYFHFLHYVSGGLKWSISDVYQKNHGRYSDRSFSSVVQRLVFARSFKIGSDGLTTTPEWSGLTVSGDQGESFPLNGKSTQWDLFQVAFKQESPAQSLVEVTVSTNSLYSFCFIYHMIILWHTPIKCMHDRRCSENILHQYYWFSDRMSS